MLAILQRFENGFLKFLNLAAKVIGIRHCPIGAPRAREVAEAEVEVYGFLSVLDSGLILLGAELRFGKAEVGEGMGRGEVISPFTWVGRPRPYGFHRRCSRFDCAFQVTRAHLDEGEAV